MDFEVRWMRPFLMLGIAGGFDEIADLWSRTGQAIDPGGLASSNPRVQACAAEFHRGDSVVYAAGVPCEPGAHHPGLELIGIPGGRYAFVAHRGSYQKVPTVARTLGDALRAAGYSATAHWVELCYPDDEDGRRHVDMGVLVADR